MRRLSLSTLLIGLNAGLVLVAVVAVAFAAVGLLERFADEQALARVNLAGMSAEEAVERSARDVATSAHLLAERPTVKRLLGEGDAAGLTAFLDRFRTTSHLSGVVIFNGGRIFAAGGAPLPWEEIAGRAGREGISTLIRLPDGSLVLAAASPLASAPESSAAAALVLDAPFVRQTGAQVGLPVAILDRERALGDPDDPRMPLRAEVLATGEPGSALLKKADRYLSVRPLRTPAGEVAALVETGLPWDSVAASLARLVRTLLLLALLVAAVATVSGWAISRRLTRPVEALTAAAARIGRGDLSTPAPRAPGAELGTLAATMEEMRRRLLQLTSELRRRQAEGEAILTGITEGVYSVDRDRRIRYLNPQAAALLGIRREEALGRFCGDVLNPRGKDGVRPCEESCPIVHARFRGGASATESLQLADGSRRAVVIASAPPAEEQQFQVLRDETDVEAARRAARRRAGQHLARVPHPALGATRLHRAAARPAPPVPWRPRKRDAGPRPVAGAGEPAPDAAHRQPARKRAHRVRAGRPPQSARGLGRGDRGGGGDDGAPPRPARPDDRGGPPLPAAAALRRRAAAHPGVREPAGQRQQIRPCGLGGPRRR